MPLRQLATSEAKIDFLRRTGLKPLRVDVAFIWTRRRESDADHRWFRNVVIEQFRDERFRD